MAENNYNKLSNEAENTSEIPAKKPNLYSGAKVSVKFLNVAIVVLILILALVMKLLISNPGLTVSFETDGGSRVENAEYLHGDLITPPAKPVKEGFVFTGWYKDPNCKTQWDFQKDTVGQTMTLYAGWKAKT